MSLTPDLKALGMQIISHALVIADGTVRGDVESYALPRHHQDGFFFYDLRAAQVTGVSTDEEQAEWTLIAQRAAKYIRLRGDVWPWSMVFVDGDENLVRFVDKPLNNEETKA